MRISTQLPEIDLLRTAIEHKVGHSLCCPTDFENLSNAIYEQRHEIINPFTLRRLWGYLTTYKSVNTNTLHILTQFAGYRSWEHFCSTVNEQSDFVNDNCIWTSALEEQSRILLTWNPERKCILRYLGNQSFIVEETVNTKLHAGDRLQCARFCIGEPLYAHILRENATDTTYTAARRDGLTSVQQINAKE